MPPELGKEEPIKKLTLFLSFVFLTVFFAPLLRAKETLTLASTTSTLDSGLFEALIPPFEKKFSCTVKVIAVGTGQAMRLARDGNADVLLVHDREAEEKFVADGFGLERLDVMHNDFVLVGPAADPARVGGQKAAAAFQRIAAAAAPFASRGDDSGTHKKELKLWRAAGVTPGGAWYLESGTGMEATLRIAAEKGAYCLVDRATWLAHQKEIDALAILAQGDDQLFNPYSVVVVSPAKFPWLNARLAARFAEFIRSVEGQAIIRAFGRERFGAPLFFPDVVR
ncbi:MAG: substrate-binding domain-containing protein [Acidobacteria bacterium]|jgi:tungstate transport system substrate-binding protein|nr:substrate-binding domain-containing protein [Acidobacteriota bacterium]